MYNSFHNKNLLKRIGFYSHLGIYIKYFFYIISPNCIKIRLVSRIVSFHCSNYVILAETLGSLVYFCNEYIFNLLQYNITSIKHYGVIHVSQILVMHSTY